MDNTAEIRCPKCSSGSFWKTADRRLKCKKCCFLFTPKPNPLNVSNDILKTIISEFLLEHSTNVILERVKISKYKLLKALRVLRLVMTLDMPDAFEGLIKEKFSDFTQPKEIPKHPVIGIICLNGKIHARVLPDIEKHDLKFLTSLRAGVNDLEPWQKNMGLAFRGSLWRLRPTAKGKKQIDLVDAFWGYLKRKLSLKGGIRKEKLPLYLGEYVWKYNMKKLTLAEQEKRLLDLVLAGPKFYNKAT